MDSYLKIKFKDKAYTITSMVDFNSEHSKEKSPHNVYYITTEEMPEGLTADIASRNPREIEIFDVKLWRPSIRMQTYMNKETKTLQYLIIISDKGE